MLEAITSLKYVDEKVENYEDYEPGGFSRDTIALVRSLVNSVSAIYNQILLLLIKYRFVAVISKATIFRMCTTIFREGLSATS